MPSELSAEEYLKAKQAYYRQCLNLGPQRPEKEVLALALDEVKKREEQSIRQDINPANKYIQPRSNMI